MNETVKLVLSLSLSGSILAGLIFMMKPFIKYRLSKTIQYYIWIVVLVRLMIPFSFEESMMNKVFYDYQTSVVKNAPSDENSSLINVQENVKNGVYTDDADHQRYLNDLFVQYVLYVWLLGVMIALAINLIGYHRFWKHLKKANKPADNAENLILYGLSPRQKNVSLLRNPYVSTPMLLGIIKPYIIIPDLNFDEKQLKNILLHELTHLRHFDIGVKWLTMIATSIHWFNPLMYLIKKEINHACELACDEAVIRHLNAADKHSYGNTLISIVAENKYPIGVLQATMNEEMNTLKERLVAIMKYTPKSKLTMLFSTVLITAIIGGAILLGAGTGIYKDVVYQNDKYGFSLSLPKDFAEDIEIRDMGNSIYFIDKEIQETQPNDTFGVVARIETYNKEEFTRESLQANEDAYGLRYLGENEKYYFGYAYSTDVQFPPNAADLRNNFREMEGQFGVIIKTFKII